MCVCVEELLWLLRVVLWQNLASFLPMDLRVVLFLDVCALSLLVLLLDDVVG